MKAKMLLVAAGAIMLPHATLMAAPSGTASGWDHLNGPTSTGQPGAECGEEEAPNTPGHASTAPGSAFNEEGTAHGVYAGEQPQNSRNTASVSQYDTGCLIHPRVHDDE